MGKIQAHVRTRQSSLRIDGFKANQVILNMLASGHEVNLSRGRLVIQKPKAKKAPQQRRRFVPVLVVFAAFGMSAVYATSGGVLGSQGNARNVSDSVVKQGEIEESATHSEKKSQDKNSAPRTCPSTSPIRVIDFGGVLVLPSNGCEGYSVRSKKKEG